MNLPAGFPFPLALKTVRLLGTLFAATLAATISFATTPAPSAAPQVGDRAPTFTLNTLDDQPIELARIGQDKKIVLVVLRGWPGYQCPFCTTQVYEYVGHAEDFAARNIQVVMVYPGPAEQLRAHANEFLGDKHWPKGFFFVIDPDYTFTNRYGLRWNAKNETAYPSTFVIDESGKISFAHISREHGDRMGAAALLRIIDPKK